MTAFAKLIRKIQRAEEKRIGDTVSIREMAAWCGLSHGVIYFLMQGKHWPSESTIEALCVGLEVSEKKLRRVLDQTFD